MSTKRFGIIALGLCLRLLIIGALGVWGADKVAEHVGMRLAIPDLQLSAVIHGSQKEWCYDFAAGQNTEGSEKATRFAQFVSSDLAKYTTQVTYLKPNKMIVTWQATPHNQCQFIFESEQGGVRIRRRLFSLDHTLQPQGKYFKVKDQLTREQVAAEVDMSLAPTDLGMVQNTSFDALKIAFGVDATPSSAGLSSGQIEFIQKLFAEPSAESTAAQSKPGPAPGSVEQHLWQWMYGTSEKTMRDMYYQRRD